MSHITDISDNSFFLLKYLFTIQLPTSASLSSSFYRDESLLDPVPLSLPQNGDCVEEVLCVLGVVKRISDL